MLISFYILSYTWSKQIVKERIFFEIIMENTKKSLIEYKKKTKKLPKIVAKQTKNNEKTVKSSIIFEKNGLFDFIKFFYKLKYKIKHYFCTPK